MRVLFLSLHIQFRPRRWRRRSRAGSRALRVVAAPSAPSEPSWLVKREAQTRSPVAVPAGHPVPGRLREPRARYQRPLAAGESFLGSTAIHTAVPDLRVLSVADGPDAEVDAHALGEGFELEGIGRAHVRTQVTT